jgi:hypothetical protein
MWFKSFQVKSEKIILSSSDCLATFRTMQYAISKVTIAKENSNTIPDIYYAVYQNIIAINHFKTRLTFFVIV